MLFRNTRQRFAQFRRGLPHLGEALLIVDLKHVEVATADGTIHFVETDELAAAAAEAQQRREAA